MKLVNRFRTSGGFIFLALVVFLPGQLADADPIIYESATMGAAGQTSGWGIDSIWFMGSRFYIDQQVQVTAVGGHMLEWTAGNFFGAIVSLDSAGDLPDGYPFYTSEVVASTVFDPGVPSSDFRTPLSVTLQPGYYALIFGSGEFGSTSGEGAMPYVDQSNLPGASYILWDGSGWWNSASDRARFVVEGVITPSYCSASGAICYEYVAGVEVGEISNMTGCNNYYDYTSLSTTMEIGTGYPITVTNGCPWDEYDNCGVWVDWNQDMDFDDAGEEIAMSFGETTPGGGGIGAATFVGVITPPSDANLGDTRMRVRVIWNEVAYPCGTTNYGEVEDYTINVTGAPSFVTISGYVKTSNGIGIKDVLVSASTGETDTTDVDGYYERTLSSPWSGTITPSKTDWTFEPVDRAYVNLITNISNADFTGAHTIYGGGKGTADDPYLIFTASQMNSIGTCYVDLYSHFKLMADIDLGSYTGDSFNIIGGPLSKFRGVFDGNGKRIYNFTYTSVSPNIHIKGIFKHLDGANAEIKDLGLVNPNLNGGAGTEVGALVGRLSGDGSISGCYVEGGSVSGRSTVGGLVGLVENGTISSCYASCDVSGNKDEVGGLVGENEDNVTISNSYAKGTVSGDMYVGGFVGSNHGTLSDCYATGNVTGNYDVGGLIGRNFGYDSVVDCFWDVNSSGLDSSAGGTGLTTTEMQDPNTFLDTGWDFVYESENGPSDIWAEPVGGGYMILWFQLSPLPELPTFSGGSGTVEFPYLISTANELNKIGHNPRLMGANFKLIDDIDLAGIGFFIIANEAYPFRGIFDGNGHEISNFAYHANTSDMGLFGYVDGENAKVKHLGLIDPNVNAGEGDHVGSLVSWLGSLGTISDCYAKGGSVSGDNDIGGLVGWNEGTISNCYATVNVPGDRQVGGLCGLNWNTISNCYATGSVTGDTDVGGLCGDNDWGTISNCYATGSVTGDTDVGGLCGDNDYGTISNCYALGNVSGDKFLGGLCGSHSYGTISNCYATGAVNGYDYLGGLVGWKYLGTVSNSFWDVNSSGMDTSTGGTGKTTEEMYMESTFTSVGWDFTTPVWEICDGTNYPKLAWQIPLPGDFVCPDGVEMRDFAILGAQWRQPPAEPSADIAPNGGDNIVDRFDLAALANNWLAGR